MPKFFHKIKRHNDRPNRPVTPGELVDPILYQGDLESDKYPPLSQKAAEKPVEEPENPLNKR